MPQLDILTFPSQIFWLMVTFFGLFLLVKYVIMPRMDQIQDARWERQDNNLQRASELKEEAQALLLRIDAIMDKAREEAAAHIRSCEDKIKADTDHALQALSGELSEKIAKAEQDLQHKKEKALKELPHLMADLSTVLLAKLQTGDEGPVPEKSKKPRKKADAE
jgi:F-type H+-transporting ATPase subunit b